MTINKMRKIYSTHIIGQEVLDIEIPSYVSGRKVLNIEKAKHPPLREKMYLTCTSSRKVLNAKITKQSSPTHKRSQKVDDVEVIPSEVTTSRTSHMIKLSAKARDVRYLLGQKPSTTEQNSEIENLILSQLGSCKARKKPIPKV